MRWPKSWSLSFRICPSSEHSGLIFFRMDQFVLLAVQGTLKSLLQHHNSKASILRQSAFFMVLLLLPYIATGKTIALTMWTFVGKMKSKSKFGQVLEILCCVSGDCTRNFWQRICTASSDYKWQDSVLWNCNS